MSIGLTVMTRKLKSTARRKRRNNKLIAVILLVIVAVSVGTIFVVQSSLNGASANQTNSNTSDNVNGTKLEGSLRVLLQTSMGNITIQLRDDKPITAGNFRNLVERGVYDGALFNRVETYLIQVSDISQTVSSIHDEVGGNNTNARGTLAMTKSTPNTAASGFFINVEDNYKQSAEVDKTYTVFGYVISGMDVVDAISHVKVDDPNGVSPKPVDDVTIIKAVMLP